MNNEINNMIISAINCKPTPKGQTITATLADGQEAVYTKAILPMMIGDPSVRKIVDNASGEIIYMA